MRDWLGSGALRRTQLELAGLAEVDPANISRWLSGQSKPDLEAVERMAGKLEPGEASRLLVAWLRDRTPSSLRHLVEVTPGVARVAEDATERFPDGMSAELRERLVFFGRLAMENPDVRRIIDVCYEAAKRGRAGEQERRLGRQEGTAR